MREARFADRHGDAVGDLAAVVLDTVSKLVTELHSGAPETAVHPDSALDADLGLDSLSVAELRVRLERACAVRLPDQALAGASTPADWVRFIVEARTHTPPSRPAPTEGLMWLPELRRCARAASAALFASYAWAASVRDAGGPHLQRLAPADPQV